MLHKTGKYTYDVTLRLVRESLLQWKRIHITYLRVCACVRACMYVPGRVACACAYMHVALLMQHIVR